jgi:trk system potassium uptake protein TrkH
MRIGGMQLFLTENSDKSQKFLPKSSQIVGFFLGIYIAVIIIFAILLRSAGMGVFDSVCHSVAAISTGGFSTKNVGIDWFDNNQIKLIMSLAMFIGGMTFLEVVKCCKNRGRGFLKTRQTNGYFKIVICTTLVPIIMYTIFKNSTISTKEITDHIFQVISAITTTGYDYHQHCMVPQILLMILAIVGGCSGSTAGGIKIFRIQMIGSILKHHAYNLVKPHSINIPKYRGQKIDESLVISVTSLVVLSIIVFVVSVCALEMVSKIGIMNCSYYVFSCLFNLGCEIDFYSASNIVKFILMCDMITGRLEIIPVIVVLSRIFWKK